MDIPMAKLIYFSPTGTTRKILEGVGAGVQADKIEQIDLTPFESGNFEIKEIHNELAIIGRPVYAGRIPVEAAKMTRPDAELIELEIETLHGTKTLKLTPDHKVFSKNRGYIRADELDENDELIISV